MTKKTAESSGFVAVRHDSCRTDNFEKKESRKLIISIPFGEKNWSLTEKAEFVGDFRGKLLNGGLTLKTYNVIKDSVLCSYGVHDIEEKHQRRFFYDATKMVVEGSLPVQPVN